MLSKENPKIAWFALAWFLINLVQSYFTEILEDEAYYWVYSEFLAWGYFDHPPMIAILIKLGSAIIPGELGVRLFPSLLGAATILIVYQLIPKGNRDPRIFIICIVAITLMHLNVAGFLALPDIPLVFFTSLFFLVLKRFLDEDRMVQALGLGVIIALMMYSKYHALLIIFFTILSDWKLILRKTFWVIVAVAVILYLPHIIWQVKNNFVSFQYHLISRNDPFQPRQILEYLGNQLVVTGPFVGFLLLFLAFTRPAKNAYERMLKFNLIGFFGFFFLSSVRGHVEPHWTAAAFPPMIVLAMLNLNSYPGLRKWVRVLGLASIPVILVIRLYLIVEILPMPVHVSRMFHDKDKWVKQIGEVAGDRPVVFMNKYQHPSLYWFYNKKLAFTRNTVMYRRNQYDVWNLEEELHGKQVLLTHWGKVDSTRVIETAWGEVYYYNIERFCSFNRLSVKILEKKLQSAPGEQIIVPVQIGNPTHQPVCLDCPCDLPPMLYQSVVDRDRVFLHDRIQEQPRLTSLEPGEQILLDIQIRVPEEPGDYLLTISFGSELLTPGINGVPVKLKVTDPPL
ncbi:MAG: glycosyltransferase family 39 protein [Bacteroidales bacterium]